MLKACFTLCFLLAFCLVQPATTGTAGPGEASHVRYSSAGHDMETWLQQLTPPQQIKAREILEEYRPRVRELRRRIEMKKRELESLNYDQETSPDTLPRLGRELLVLRDELQAILICVDERMRREVGVPLGSPDSRGCRMGHPGIIDEGDEGDE